MWSLNRGFCFHLQKRKVWWNHSVFVVIRTNALCFCHDCNFNCLLTFQKLQDCLQIAVITFVSVCSCLVGYWRTVRSERVAKECWCRFRLISNFQFCGYMEYKRKVYHIKHGQNAGIRINIPYVFLPFRKMHLCLFAFIRCFCSTWEKHWTATTEKCFRCDCIVFIFVVKNQHLII